MTDLPIWFDHGLGDCVHFIHMLELCRKRGYSPRVHYEQNKAPVWEAAGIPFADMGGSPRHQFLYLDSFNHPTAECEWSGNKMAGCFNVPPLPILGPIEEIWEDFCNVDLSHTFYRVATDEDIRQAQSFLANCPRPIILLHTQGSNWSESKNLSRDNTIKLYNALLDQFPGTVVLMDWDNRVPMLPHARIRHLKRDWGHLSLNQAAALYREASLLIGVDSGPYHLAAMTDVPALGVFTGHYPSCVTLARSRSAVMTRATPERLPINRTRRPRWSIIEYTGIEPDASVIATHAMRMLAGCRYLRDTARIGRDVMLQQLVRDYLRQSNTLSPRSDRDVTMDWLLRETSRGFEHPRIVETGCIRSEDDWSAGYSTYIFGCFLEGLHGGRLETVDINQERLDTARRLCQPWGDRITYHCSDSVAWLQQWGELIDVLYLDSLDTEEPNHAHHCLAEIRAAEHCLHAGSIVVIDDTVWNHDWTGKGALAVPYMLGTGWQLSASGYQCVLTRPAA